MQQVLSLIHAFTWMDSLLLVVIILCAVEGFALGVVLSTADLITFVVSFLAGLKLYSLAGLPLEQFVHISKGYAHALGFFITAFITELILHFLLRRVVKKVNETELIKQAKVSRVNNILGILPGVLSGGVLLMFILTVIVTLPSSPFLKNAVTNSHLGAFLVDRSQSIEQQVSGAFGGAANDTLNFMTVEPQSSSSVSLGFTTSKATVDQSAEVQMFSLLNNERTTRGLSELTQDKKLQQLGRDYAQEMLSRGYFSHYTPEGLSPFDRMAARDIIFTYAGENLAFSPNVALAMQGLMNSPGHRANMLSPNFHRVGIGVLDAGIYGEMFVQEFTD